MSTVLAQGTFDILHPGHLHYLREAAAQGDELHVIVARATNVTHKEPPVLSGIQRREMVDALEMVDQAHLGHADDIFELVGTIDPDVIVLGHDQHHDVTEIQETLNERGINCAVRRASARGSDGDRLLSTRAIINRILDERSAH